MRVLLFGAWVAVITSGQEPRPFSHRIHLALKLACTSCHAAAATSARADDDLLPSRGVCLRCHERADTGSPLPTKVARFSHEQHLKLGNIAPIIAAAIDSRAYLSPAGDLRAQLNTRNACEACHRGLASSDRVSRAVLPAMADCLVCHNKIDPPFSCETCHANDADLKPANHTPDFIDTHTTGKLKLDKTTCALCHGRQFTCLGCH